MKSVEKLSAPIFFVCVLTFGQSILAEDMGFASENKQAVVLPRRASPIVNEMNVAPSLSRSFDRANLQLPINSSVPVKWLDDETEEDLKRSDLHGPGRRVLNIPARVGNRILFDSYADQAHEKLQIRAYREAAKLLELARIQIDTTGQNDPKYKQILSELIQCYSILEEPDKCIMLQRELTAKPLPTTNVEVSSLKQPSMYDKAMGDLEKAWKLQELGKPEQAEDALKALYYGYGGGAYATPTFRALAVNKLAQLYVETGRQNNAVAFLNEALKNMQDAMLTQSSEPDLKIATASILCDLGRIQRDKKELIEAEAVYNQALKYAIATKGAGLEREFSILSELGYLHLSMDNPREAVSNFERALDLRKSPKISVPISAVDSTKEGLELALRLSRAKAK